MQDAKAEAEIQFVCLPPNHDHVFCCSNVADNWNTGNHFPLDPRFRGDDWCAGCMFISY
mgnify:CR=1 FL=1